MKLHIVLASLAVLFLNACDSNEPGQQSAREQESAPVEQLKPAVNEPVVVEETIMPESRQAVAANQAVSGESIYKRTCSACHATGAANAPRPGDKAAWKPRIEKGMDVLLQSAINGVPGTAMTKRGTCANCSDDDLKAVIEYMVSQSR
ncbi:MAG: hypothetical protein QG652_773 [Pseudomonadota bacterium]|nr:hypothetical protein [Pseudomonadota bacterium]